MSSPSPDSCSLTPDRSSDAEILVKVENVSKIFCRDLKKSLLYGLQDSARDLMAWGKRETLPPIDQGPRTKDQGRGLRPGEFYAVNNVSFELRRGECLGLIGRNGAGKTTLLKMLNGLIKPDAGRIEMRGRVGALIALGAGFNPILSGRENIYVNGSILGLTKAEIDAKIDEIIDFAEIGEFIDAPVQSYSSGMQVRLGFAVATAMEPDVLILDEVLAVGDAAFRAKCYNRVGKLQKSAAVIYVSHSMAQIAQMASSVLFIARGHSSVIDEVSTGIAKYENDNCSPLQNDDALLVIEAPVIAASLSFSKDSIESGSFVTARVELELLATMAKASIRIILYNPEGLFAAEWNSMRSNIAVDLKSGKNIIEIKLGPINLLPNNYKIAFALNDQTGLNLPFWSLKRHSLRVIGTSGGLCDYQLPHEAYEILIG